MADPNEMVYYNYTVSQGDHTTEGRVTRLEKQAKDHLFKESGLVKEIAERAEKDVGCAYVFDPPVELKPGMVITIKD